jgi:thioredoxin-related protein
MPRTISSLLLAILLVPAGAAVSGEKPALTWQSFDSCAIKAKKGDLKILVDVYTDWCGWCKRMDRDVYARRDVQDYLSRRFVTVKLNAESNEMARYEGQSYTSRALAARFGVNGYPTTIFLSSRGAFLGNVPGYAPPDRFLLLLRYIGDGHMEKGESFESFSKAAAANAPEAKRSGRR